MSITVERDEILSVSQLTSQIKSLIEPEFSWVHVAGELSDVSASSAGHIYLTLSDEHSQIRAVIWRSAAGRVDFELQDGMQVICSGGINLYPPRGTYQLVVSRIEPVGIGAQQLALRQLMQRLKAEGLFDPRHKKPLPAFARRIGIVTSPTGAALHDICQVVWRRWRDVHLFVFPTQVQGDLAVPQITAAIQAANQMRPALDVLIVVRGGGSSEDINCFNNESVVRAVFDSVVPVISAVGHEIDVTLCDLAADVRALTPSQAGELAVPDGQQLGRQLALVWSRMRGALAARTENARRQLAGLAERAVFRRPLDRIHRQAQRCDELEHRLAQAMVNSVHRQRARATELSGRLDAISPLNVLARGYSLTLDADGRIITDAAKVSVGDAIESQVSHGRLRSRVEAVSPKSDSTRMKPDEQKTKDRT